ncbi:type VI secretion system Vgr family protein [Motiliproteus sp. MSK22-1]|uniref:type VI secretion system Vgr family protein n=1 Tax=Motiliproteus sp. MSK22-1 TaxID=1897630 RepID=UPI000975374C|nr:type VI secretion system tip protein VgrG [Motiliproteus sp. MSK22-1]OMH38671.1 type VI secretion protein ImpA [Motiliproteus sp. MSK22-1]
MPITQSERIISIQSPLGSDTLVFQRMTGQESLGQLFEYKLEMLSEDHSIQFTDLLGQNITVELEAENEETRYFNGFVSQFDYSGTVDRYSIYHAKIRPWLWFLTRTADCRIFQELNATDIIQEVFRDNGFSDFELSVSRSCTPREYCVQYRESDFDFVSRLMEEEGIYYYFKHESSKHTLVLTDDISSHENSGKILYYPPDQDRRDEQHIDHWRTKTQVRSGKYVADDFDFVKPKQDLESRSANPGGHEQSDKEIYDYPGNYYEKGLGDDLTRIRLEELQSVAEVGRGRGNSSKITTGKLFELSDYPREDQNTEYLVTETQLDIWSDQYISQSASSESNTREDVLRCKFRTLKRTTPFRSPSITPKTRVKGPQTAIVVGPSGEEIYTDKHGRVKVQFHWDRLGKSDENSSCWIRVSQNWAGKRWGGVFLPRIGQEVIVDFLEGDPDRPIITGRVYNGDNTPPYGLPANKTQSGIKSRSSKEGSEDNFNELRFEDKKGQEEVYFHAEKDFNRVVENDDTLKVGFDKMDPGDQTIDIYNNRTVTIDQGDDTLTVKTGDRTDTIEKGDDTHTVKLGNLTVNVNAGKSYHEAAQSIELVCGASSIKLEPAKISIKSPQIEIKADAKLDAESPMTTVKGTAVLTLKGGVILIN